MDNLKSDEGWQLMAVEIWFLRRRLRISWTEKKSNVSVMTAAGV